MFWLNDARYATEMEKAKLISMQRKRINEINAERSKYKKPIETNKVIAIYLFAMLNVLIIFSMIAMWHFADLSYLGVLISDIGAQIVLYGIYCLKAYHGKKQEEEMKFKRETTLTPNANEEPLG